MTAGLVESYEAIVSVLTTTNDLQGALSFLSLNLQSLVQLQGLDSTDVLNTHIQMGNLLIEHNDLDACLKHFLAAKYIVELLGGRNHPHLCMLYQRLALLYSKMPGGQYKKEQQFCIEEALKRSTQIELELVLQQQVAALKMVKGEVTEAMSEQKQVFRLSIELYGELDKRTVEAKSCLERYLRVSTEMKLKHHQAQVAKIQQVQASDAAKKKAEQDRILLQEHVRAKGGGSKGRKNTKK